MRSNNILALALATALFGCASVSNKESKSSFNHVYKIEPTKTSDLIQAENAEQYYQIGRKYQKDGKYDLAIMAFQKALLVENKNTATLQNNYTNSITGLASTYAGQKLYSQAIPLFKEVVILNPTPAHFNNLGYAYYLNEQYEEASKSLNQALALDPQYTQARKNLSLVSQNLDVTIIDEKGSNLVKSTTISNQEEIIHDADQEKVNEGSPLILDQKLTLNQTNNGIYELNYEKSTQKLTDINTKTVSNNKVKNDTKKTIQVLASGGISFKLMPAMNLLFDINNNMLALFMPSNTKKYIEVINGIGIKSIARSVVDKLKEGGSSKNYRVANAKRFNESKTYIQYNSEFREDAVKLKYSLLNHPVLVKNDNLPNDVMIRLVLGRDLLTENRKAGV